MKHRAARCFFTLAAIAAAFTVVVPATQATDQPLPPTVTQTRTLPNGYSVSITVGQDQQPATSTNTLSCGSMSAYGQMHYVNPYGVTLWTYRQQVGWNFCNYTVTGVWSLFDQPVDTCCYWSWAGNVTRSHTPVGGANITTYTQGHFHACIPLPVNVCMDKYPWISLRVNGNGNLTGFWWGT